MTKASETPLNPYLRIIKGVEVDAYDIIRAYDIRCPAQQHALKKLLGRGSGEKTRHEELREIKQSIQRAIDFEFQNAAAKLEEKAKQPAAPEERQVCVWSATEGGFWDAFCDGCTHIKKHAVCPGCGKPVRFEG